MSQRKLTRKRAEPAARNHLRLVPPPKRRRRRFKVGHIRKPKYHTVPELLKYEEEIVLAAVREAGGSVSAASLVGLWPGRFRERQLYLTLVRLAQQGRLETSGSYDIGRWFGYTPQMLGRRWWTTKHNRHRRFWTPGWLEQRRGET